VVYQLPMTLQVMCTRLLLVVTCQTAEGAIFQSDVLDSPLSNRGWILQERVLSPRILHFGKTQLFWECRAKCFAEDGHLFQQQSRDKNIAPFLNLLHDPSMSSNGIYRAWSAIVEEYSSRKLTKGSDKFSALSGLARVVAMRSNDTYLAGLWLRNLHWDLQWTTYQVWEPDFRKSDKQWRAPSWSWACWNYKVGTFLVGNADRRTRKYCVDFKSGFKFIRADLDPKDQDPYGQLKSASLHLQGILRPAVDLGPYNCSYDGFSGEYNPIYESDTNMIPIGDMSADDKSSGHNANVFCFKMFDRYFDDGDGPTYRCLILIPTGQREGEFRRVGIGEVRDNYFKDNKRDYFDGYTEVDIILI